MALNSGKTRSKFINKIIIHLFLKGYIARRLLIEATRQVRIAAKKIMQGENYTVLRELNLYWPNKEIAFARPCEEIRGVVRSLVSLNHGRQALCIETPNQIKLVGVGRNQTFVDYLGHSLVLKIDSRGNVASCQHQQESNFSQSKVIEKQECSSQLSLERNNF